MTTGPSLIKKLIKKRFCDLSGINGLIDTYIECKDIKVIMLSEESSVLQVISS